MERNRGLNHSKTKREIAKQLELRQQKRRTMTRRALLLGGGSIAALAVGGYLTKELTKSPDGFTDEDLSRAALLAMDDYEAVLGQSFDREQVMSALSLRERNREESGVDVGGGEAVSIASTTAEFPSTITISKEFLDSLPTTEREKMARVLLIHELWHYSAPTGSDPETSQYLFSKIPKLDILKLDPKFTKGFRVAGTSQIDGKDYSWFNGVEEASAFAAGDYIAQQRGLLDPKSSYILGHSFQDETRVFQYFMDHAFPDKLTGLKTIAAIRAEDQPLRNFSKHIGETNLGLEGDKAIEAGLAVLSYVNSGNFESMRQLVG